MVQGLTGQKTGLSETKETQFRNMLTTTMMALRHIALKDYKPVVTNGDTTINVKEEDYLQQHPEAKPVVVLDSFEGKADINGFVYRELSDWATMLVQTNVAHVIFLTETIGSNQVLTESFPNQVFKTLILSDASKENSREYVLYRLKENQIQKEEATNENEDAPEQKVNIFDEKDLHDIDEVLEPLGGRMLDLQASFC